jgi:Ca-activated chloride channel family protein
LPKRDKSRQRVIVLITDGQVGNEDQLVKLVRQKARGTRVFTVGIDRAVNAAFLKRLAIPTGGLFELVESEERLDTVMTAMHRRIGRPSMTDIQIDDSNLKIVPGSLVPDKMPDLFEGVPAVIMGRFTGATDGQVTISGQVGEEKYREKLEAISRQMKQLGLPGQEDV